VATLAAVISIAVGDGGPEAPATEGFSDVQQLFAGVPQEGASLGADDAPVLMTVYNDLRCLSCAGYQVEEIDLVIERHVRADDVRFDFSHFSLGPEEVSLAALAATAAGEQGRQWQYIDLLMRNLEPAGEADDDFLTDVAKAVPELGDQEALAAWEADRTSDEVRAIVDADAAEAVERRLSPEPAVVVSGPGGERTLEGAPTSEEIEAAIAAIS